MYSQQKKLLQLHVADSKNEIKRNRERKEKSVSPSIFIAKTFEILENNFYSDVVSWNHEGTNFMINDIVRFEQEVLPLYFRHRKFSSFVRQLNMYDFHKIRNEANKNIFEHKEFRRHSHQSLRNIRRKGCGSNRRCEITDGNEQIEDAFESSEYSNYEDHFGKSIDNRRTIESIERFHNSPSTLAISHQTVEERERAINEFVESLPGGLESQLEIKSIIDEMKRNSKFNWVSSKQDIRKVIKKIKRSKMTKRIELEGLEDLSIEEEIMVENIDSRQVDLPELELFRSQIWPSFLENGSCMMLPVAAQICENWLFEV